MLQLRRSSVRLKFLCSGFLLFALLLPPRAPADQSLAESFAAASGVTDALSLAPGRPIARTLSGGEAHSYQLTLAASQYLHALVEQSGIDAEVALFAPGGERLAAGSSLFTTQATEPLVLEAVTGAAGVYRLEIRARKRDVAAGLYEAQIVALRAATPFDRERVAAQEVFAAGNRLRAQESWTWPAVLERYEAALSLFRAAGDRQGEAAALAAIGWVHLASGEDRQGLDYSHQALALFRALGDQRGEARALERVGWAQHNFGEQEQALAYLQQAALLHRAAGDRRGEATALRNISRIHHRLLQSEQAFAYAERALALFRSLGDRRGEAHLLGVISVYHQRISEQPPALDYLLRAREIFRSIGERREEARALHNLGLIYRELGERQRAIDHFAQTLTINQELGETGASIYSDIADIY